MVTDTAQEVPPTSASATPAEAAIEVVQRIDRRIDRLLADGWRNAGDDLAELAAEAASLITLGLTETAARVRAVAEADGPTAGLRAAGLAREACRLVRVRLGPDRPPAGRWAPVAPRSRAPAETRLLPLGRFALADGEVWSCLRLHGGYPVAWVLIDPPAARGGVDLGHAVPWLVRPIVGRLRWRARLPLGANGEVDVFSLEDAAVAAPPEAGIHEHGLSGLVQAMRRGRVGEESWLPANVLTLVPLDPDDLGAYSWPDTAAAGALAGAAARVKDGWLLVWTAGVQTPIAAISSPPARSGVGALSNAIRGRPRPHVVHLVAGLPSENLADPPDPAT